MEKQNEKSKKKRGKKSAMNVLGGSFLVKEKFTKQFPFMVYITILLMAIITNTYIAEDQCGEITSTAKRLNDLQVEYVQVKSAIMEASKQSVLVKKMANTGLKEAVEPMKHLEVEQPEKQEEP